IRYGNQVRRTRRRGAGGSGRDVGAAGPERVERVMRILRRGRRGAGAADGARAGRDAAAPAPSAADAQARIEAWAVCMAVRTSSRVTVPPVAMVANIPFIAWPTVVSNWSSQGTSGSGSERSA